MTLGKGAFLFQLHYQINVRETEEAIRNGQSREKKKGQSRMDNPEKLTQSCMEPEIVISCVLF